MAKRPNVNYQKSNDSRFVNPYNFVSTDMSKKSKGDVHKSGLISGGIACEIIAKSPLAEPDIENVKKISLQSGSNGSSSQKYHIKSSFMRTPKGDYMIPGSSIRGMIRNVYETATDSCYSTIKDTVHLTSRISPYMTYPGILLKENGEWILYEAREYSLKIKKNAKNKSKAEKLAEESGMEQYEVLYNDAIIIISAGTVPIRN